MRTINLLLLFIFIYSCKSPEPRKPVTQRTDTSFIKESVKINRKIIERDEDRIKEIISSDTASNYQISERGFWYTFNNEVENDSITPTKGDELIFEYNIQKLNGDMIYSIEDLGVKEYVTDQEILFSGLRDGLKLMNEGETATFLFPSHKAFGYYGDQAKVKGNMPIKAQVTLLEINPKQNKDP